jgi:hypothetical protein
MTASGREARTDQTCPPVLATGSLAIIDAMRGRWWHRLLCAVLALWLGVFLAEPDGLHACPVHSPAGAGHASHGASHGASHHGAPASHGAGHTCTCPGPCCASAVTPLPAAAALPALAVLVVVPRAARPEHEYVAAWVDFVLPYATAPPSSLV